MKTAQTLNLELLETMKGPGLSWVKICILNKTLHILFHFTLST